MDLLNNFIHKYYIAPIYDQSLGFNIVNTLTYALVALLILYIIYWISKKLEIKFDMNFFWAVLPFIILGSTIRAFVDHEYIVYSFWTVTPGIYFLVLAIFLISFAVSYLLQHFKKYPWTYTCMYLGWAFVIVNIFLSISKIQFTNLWALPAIAGLSALISSAAFLIFKYLPKFWKSSKETLAKFTTPIVFLPFIAHILDSSATFIAVDFFGFWEKHPLTRTMSEFAGTTAIFYLLKLIFLIPLVYLLTKEVKDKNLRNYFLIVIIILGFAEGIRDTLTLIFI